MWIQGDPQPIQTSEVLAYATYMELTDEVRRELLFLVVSTLDDKYMANHWENARKEADKQRAGRGAAARK
jgi:hypothetical protein